MHEAEKLSTSLSDAFGLIAVINLPERTDRRHEALHQLELLGLTRSPGKLEFFPGQRVTSLKGFPSLGAHGCFLSHLAVLREARSRGSPSVLVLEDDFEVTHECIAPLTSLVDPIRTQPWQFLYLGHRLTLPPSAPTLIPTAGPIATAHAYAVSASIYAPLLEYLEGCLVRPPGDLIGGPMHFDGALTMFRAAHPEAITLVAHPSLVAQRSSRSDITFRAVEQIPGIRQVMNLLRLARNKWKEHRDA